MRATTLVCLVLAVPLAAGASLGQDGIPDLLEPFGNIVSTDPVGVAEGVQLAAEFVDEKKKALFFFAPTITDTEGSFVSGLSTGIVFKTKTQVDGRFLSIGLDDASANLDQHRIRIKQPIKVGDERTGLAVVGQWTDTEDLREDIALIVSGSYVLRPGDSSTRQGEIKGTINAAWTERSPDIGDSVDDVGAGIGLSFVARARVVVSLDYTSETDITNESNHSLAIQTAINQNSKIGFGLAKHSVVFANYLITF